MNIKQAIFIIATIAAFQIINQRVKTQKVEFDQALIQTCAGWRLNSLPDLKSFLQEQADDYDMEVVYPGGDPYLILMNQSRQVMRYKLTQIKKDDLLSLLSDLGIPKLLRRKADVIQNDMG